MRKTLFLLPLLLLAACDTWMGESEEPPLPGERISLRPEQKPLLPDAGLEEETVILPQMPVNGAWPQALGNATGVSGNLAFNASPEVSATATAGDGNAFVSPLVPAPVVAEGMIFAMDGQGIISAHSLEDPEKRYWQTPLDETEGDEGESLLGGGLAWKSGVLYAADDTGRVGAFTATSGSRRWTKELKLPLRSPPRVAGSLVLLLTADNQLLALEQNNGNLAWSYRGISEIAGALHATPPAVRKNTVVVTFSTGQLVALDLESGNQLWTDSLAGGDMQEAASGSLRTTSPIMATGITFAGSSQSITAFESESGRRLWERTIPVASAPWLAGNYLFLTTPKGQLAAIRGLDGGLQWVRELPKDDDSAILWQGPIVASGRIWLAGENGWLYSCDPQTGEDGQTLDLGGNLMTAPVISDNAMILLNKDAKLTVLR